ncbi:MAG: hypothetical protein J7M32_06780 [Deltaproteobacteria bacterium]|nr:hypothetical protein [Deltaproteobacteria bacterium]
MFFLSLRASGLSRAKRAKERRAHPGSRVRRTLQPLFIELLPRNPSRTASVLLSEMGSRRNTTRLTRFPDRVKEIESSQLGKKTQCAYANPLKVSLSREMVCRFL